MVAPTLSESAGGRSGLQRANKQWFGDPQSQQAHGISRYDQRVGGSDGDREVEDFLEICRGSGEPARSRTDNQARQLRSHFLFVT